ncbi:GRIP domain-containing protein [Dirofilaria immitis]|nr:GRIP domain-containing protein [Dirofilaria immitis]
MLKGSDRGKLNHSDLIKKIDEQRLQITGYESKLKEATTSVEKSHSDVQNETSSLEMNTEEKTVSEMENEALKERLAKAANETEAQAEKLESRMLELRSKIKLIEGDRERELSDHGSVLAAVQQQYAKECVNSVQLEKQITELHQKLRKKEQAFKLLETDIVSLKEELGRTQDEVKFWQKRAEKTPAIQVLESELQDIKEMSIEIGNFNRIRADLQHKIDQLEEKNTTLEDENALLEASKSVKGTDDESTSFDSLKENFIKIAQKLRDSKQAINFYELLGLEEISHEQKRRYEILKNEFEKYKSKTQAEDTLEDMESNTLSSGNECSYCALAEGDLRHMRTTVASLHDKLQCLEIDHSNAKRAMKK